MTTELNTLLAQKLPARIRRVHGMPVRLPTDFVEVVRPFAQLPGTVALMSGGTLDCARYHILGVFPRVTLSAKHSTAVFEVAGDFAKDGTTATHRITCSPFDALQALMRHYQLRHPARCPIESGLLGYLSYDLKDSLEVLPQTSIDDMGLPDLYMALPGVLVVRDKKNNTDTLFMPLTETDADHVADAQFSRFMTMLKSSADSNDSSQVTASPFRSRFTADTYMDAIETIRDYIAAGDVYQVNMSQRFDATFTGNAFELYAQMYRENPAAFFAYLNPGDHQILSTSPERFIELKHATPEDENAGTMMVETRPIKGTRPRGATPEADAALVNELLQSPKDEAELSMIVDLLRNDIGKVCRAGSVEVKEHKRLESYENVHHMISIVTGILDDGKDAVDLIRATFPGGSITGCPKIRSMEIIDELEPVRRHIYTGSIGYLSFHNTMDLSIAIRTATVSNGRMVFSVGGGIVYDSNPADEYQETLDKGRTLMRSIQGRQSEPANAASFVWRDGLIQRADDTKIAIDDEGFLYGYGFFETIRVEDGAPKMLALHLERFKRAWQWCFNDSPPDITWKDVIHQVISKNQLADQVAAVKILAAAKKKNGSALPVTLLVTARPYRHRLHDKPDKGLHLAVYPHRRHTPLASHKTMNYMFYRMAGKWAARHTLSGRTFDEALICNPDGTVSETNTANIFCRKGSEWMFPHSDHFLEGTFQTGVKSLLREWSETLHIKPVSLKELASADAVFACNALMGMVPVTAIDDTIISPDAAVCHRINKVLL